MIFSDYVSIIVLGISTLALFISWRQYVRDQSHLKLVVTLQNNITDGPMFILKAVNHGRRPVTIVNVYAKVSSGKEYPVYDTSTTLGEIEIMEFEVPFSGFFNTISSGYYIKSFEFEDTTGKRHKIKTKRLRKEVEKMLQEFWIEVLFNVISVHIPTQTAKQQVTLPSSCLVQFDWRL